MKIISQPDPDRIAARSNRALALKRITEHQDWPELVAEMEERKAVHTQRFLKQMMRGYPITEEDQLRHAGFWKGVDAVLKTPGAVERQVEKMLETVPDAQSNKE